jgi:alpha-N-arabinofuranosidase
LSSNPILTQRDLPKDRPRPITSTGHAKFVDTPSGQWWAVFLGVRPYDAANNFNTGRETFMMPVQWSDGWPRITNPGQLVQWTASAPNLPPQPRPPLPLNGDFTLHENFDGASPGPNWMTLRHPGNWWRIKQGALELDARAVALGDEGSPSLLARRQQHLNATVTTSIRFRADSDAAEAGLVAYQNDEHWYFLAVGSASSKPVVRVRLRDNDAPAGKVLAEVPIPAAGPVQLQIQTHGGSFDFRWSRDGRHWQPLLEHADGTILSTKNAGGFVGSVFALYAHDGSAAGSVGTQR